MYHPNELNLWHQRHRDLLRGVQSDRLARRLRPSRPKKVARSPLAECFDKQRPGVPADLHAGAGECA